MVRSKVNNSATSLFAYAGYSQSGCGSASIPSAVVVYLPTWFGGGGGGRTEERGREKEREQERERRKGKGERGGVERNDFITIYRCILSETYGFVKR